MSGEKYNEYIENNAESKKEEIDAAINHAKSDLDNLEAQILGGKKVDFKTPDSINHFYKIENGKIIFQLDHVKNYLSDVYKRLSGMKNQKFGEISKEKNFTGTILAIQIALKALETDPINPKKYNIGKINGEYNEITKSAINQFQTDCKLQGKDGKPGKETIGKLVENLENLIDNKRTKESEVKNNMDKIREAIEESFQLNLIRSGLLYSKSLVDKMVNYIAEGNIGTNKDEELENDIITLAGGPFRLKLKELIDNEGNKISEDMFKQLLIMEGGQGYKAQVHKKFRENFPTGPYGMVFKHIDQNGNLLKKIAPFKNGERVTREWALKNAKAYYNKRAQEWKDLLDGKGCKYNQDQLDSLVSASGGNQKPVERLKAFVVSHWNDKNAIFNYISHFATTSKGVVQGGLVARRRLEANRFMGKTDKTYAEYQKEYQEEKRKKTRRK